MGSGVVVGSCVVVGSGVVLVVGSGVVLVLCAGVVLVLCPGVVLVVGSGVSAAVLLVVVVVVGAHPFGSTTSAPGIVVEHTDAPEPEYVPGKQSRHAPDNPTWSWYFPAAHGTQAWAGDGFRTFRNSMPDGHRARFKKACH
jgi:hypothetical protein